VVPARGGRWPPFPEAQVRGFPELGPASQVDAEAEKLYRLLVEPQRHPPTLDDLGQGRLIKMSVTEAAYGAWRSPISSDLIVAESVRLSEPLLDGGSVYWLEGRPRENGRYAIVQFDTSGHIIDVIKPSFNARTHVHEYGGGAYTVHKGVIYFSNSEQDLSNQNLYRVKPCEQPAPLTSEPNLRYADLVIDETHGRLVCIREDHRTQGKVINEIVTVALDGTGSTKSLVAGNDFYSSPTLSPDGKQLAWMTWNHPNMPWTTSQLWVGEFDGTSITREQLVAGANESIFQPQWSPDGVLYFVSDRDGWWNLWRLNSGVVERVTQRAAEFGQAQWYFGLSSYAFLSAESVVCAYTAKGVWYLATLDLKSLESNELNLPYQEISYVRAQNSVVVFRGGSPTEPAGIIQLDIKGKTTKVLRRSFGDVHDLTPYISIPESIEFPTANGKTAFAFYYAPKNPDFKGPAGDRYPLLVKNHGGPTAATPNTLDLRIQYWTSRGFAVVDVNYGGSTGYGREYRFRLERNWGIVDLDDCVNVTDYLVRDKSVDSHKLAISGGSAGGYTTLCALTFRKTFRAGASYYGIGDLETLARDTHKFESHYMDWLVGPYPASAPEYRRRSPIHFVRDLNVPVIFFQGEEDPIVPPNQAEMMVAALRGRGIVFGYFLFGGEQHGFRRAETIKRALDGELYFYAAQLLREGLRF
jgi:dipeptidyl aminopeptidase/acylaminoacyl peptidase